MKVKWKFFIITVFVVLSTSFCMHAWAWHIIRPGSHVYDAKRHQEWIKAYGQWLQQAINTATEIANQVRELTSLSPGLLLSNITGLNDQLGEVMDVVHEAKGLMKTARSAEEAWNEAFEADFRTMTAEDRQNYHKNMLYTLDKTYQDSLRISKTNTPIEKDIELLNKALEASESAEGNKAAKQAEALIYSALVGQNIKTNQIASQLNAIMAARNGYTAKQEEEARITTFIQGSLGVSDPYNPTEQDEKNYTRPEGKGFIHFK